ncbi:uncharacterized protein VTP21DRAFT_8541 [Calcarisporiella thermophila]|uniref:uncharacterized protein n=1 Tax=Calcarisporiella thermophila TaxID=911321 RepID=UPI003744A2E5
MASAIRELIRKKLASDVTIFGKSYCPYSIYVKDLFNKHNIRYTLLDVDEEDSRAEIEAQLRQMTGANVLPNVFIHSRFIEWTDLLREEGDLRGFLERVSSSAEKGEMVKEPMRATA